MTDCPIICPVCGYPLQFAEKNAFCKNGHSFDRSKEGSVNLILNGSAGAGDGAEMASARKRFLAKGHYSHLLCGLKDTLKESVHPHFTVIDACCGEGYFTNALQQEFSETSFYGFDLSKRALRYAAKDSRKALFFVANISSVPVKDGSADILMHIFAPVNEREFLRILASDGVFIHVFPGKDHLMGIKRILYGEPRQNDENPGLSDAFEIISSKKISKTVTLDNASLCDLISMTPYFYRTPKDRIEKAMRLPCAETETEFIVDICKKRESGEG